MDLPDDIRAKFRAWGKKGSEARNKKLSARQRIKIATKASKAASAARRSKKQ